MSTLNALRTGAVVVAALIAAQSNALASKVLKGDTCVFESTTAVFAGGPPETLVVKWDHRSGAVSAVAWNRGGSEWSAFPGNAGAIRPEPSGAYYNADIGLTSQGASERYSFKGYIAIDKNWPSATFAAVYEGTGTAWIGAKGTVTCN